MNQLSETKGEKKAPPRTFGDNMRQLKFNLTAFRADLKFIRRVIFRELKYFIPLRELFNIFLVLGILMFVVVSFLLSLGVANTPIDRDSEKKPLDIRQKKYSNSIS